MTLGRSNEEGTMSTSDGMIDALRRAKHTLETLKADVECGRTIDPAVIEDLEKVIAEHESKH